MPTHPRKISRSIILRAEREDIEIEYALRSKANPAQPGRMVAYELQSKLPYELKGKLPNDK